LHDSSSASFVSPNKDNTNLDPNAANEKIVDDDDDIKSETSKLIDEEIKHSETVDDEIIVKEMKDEDIIE